MSAKAQHTAKGRTHVKTYAPAVFDELAEAPTLVEVLVVEDFTGDIEGEGRAHVIQAKGKDDSMTFVGMERVRGVLAGRKGTFMLEIKGSTIGKDMRSEWFVIPGSGTEQLAGLRGAGGFTAQLGQQGEVWLDYSFD